MIYVLPNIPEPLSRAICACLIRNLPTSRDDTPEQFALRDERAITALAHYIPENAAEAELAADIAIPTARRRSAATAAGRPRQRSRRRTATSSRRSPPATAWCSSRSMRNSRRTVSRQTRHDLT
jgi:hypothetical protein